MREPLVSIIVPVFNTIDTYLYHCVNSVLEQTYQNLELIIVDDGSNDKCSKLCDKLADNDGRIKVIHIKNSGVSIARNIGIKNCIGDFVVFLDSDDWMEPIAIATGIDAVKKYDAQLISWNHYYDYLNDGTFTTVPRGSMPEEVIVYEENDILERLQFDLISPEFDKRYNHVTLGAVRGVWGKIFNLQIIKQNNILFQPSLKIGEDAIFVLEYVRNINKVVFLNRYLNHYRVINTSANRRVREDIIEVRMSLLHNYMTSFDVDSKSFQTCYCREVLSCVLQCLTRYICTLNYKKGIEELNNLCNFNGISCLSTFDKRDKSFYTIQEKVLLYLIENKRILLLFLVGKTLRLIKR